MSGVIAASMPMSTETPFGQSRSSVTSPWFPGRDSVVTTETRLPRSTAASIIR